MCIYTNLTFQIWPLPLQSHIDPWPINFALCFMYTHTRTDHYKCTYTFILFYLSCAWFFYYYYYFRLTTWRSSLDLPNAHALVYSTSTSLWWIFNICRIYIESNWTIWFIEKRTSEKEKARNILPGKQANQNRRLLFFCVRVKKKKIVPAFIFKGRKNQNSFLFISNSYICRVK